MSYLTWIVLIGTSLLGSVAGVLGGFAVLRRRALVGDLLSHAALPGLCLAFLILGQRHFAGMLAGAFCTGLAAIGLVTVVCRWTRTKEDAAIGIVLSTFFGVGIVLSSVIQNQTGGGAKAGLESYIYGQAAGMILRDVHLIAAVSAVALLIVTLLYKEFKLLSFDPGFARAQGWPTLALDLTMMGTLAWVTVIGLPAVGVVLMAAMLILPAATARFWTHRLGPMLLLSGVLGGLTGVIGTLLSAGVVADWLGFDPLAFGPSEAKLPPGPLIVLCGTTLFLFSVLFAPRTGVLARVAAGMRLRLVTAQENLLRSMYELGESGGGWQPAPQPAPHGPSIPIDRLLARRSWSVASLRWILWLAGRRGLIERATEGPRLTERGFARARQLVRAHRLWELFLIQGADIAPDHVDRDADSVEHLLSDEIIAQIESRLASAGVRIGPSEEPPGSPHQSSPLDTEKE